MTEDVPTRLNDCTPGDVVVVVWRDRGTILDGTEQYVQFFGAMGGRRKGSSKRDLDGAWSIVELVDHETMRPLSHGLITTYNMFIIDNLEVVSIVRPSRYGRLGVDAERKVDAQDDGTDPLLRRSQPLTRRE